MDVHIENSETTFEFCARSGPMSVDRCDWLALAAVYKWWSARVELNAIRFRTVFSLYPASKSCKT